MHAEGLGFVALEIGHMEGLGLGIEFGYGSLSLSISDANRLIDAAEIITACLDLGQGTDQLAVDAFQLGGEVRAKGLSFLALDIGHTEGLGLGIGFGHDSHSFFCFLNLV